MTERMCDVYWQGPFDPQDQPNLGKPNHVLYALSGAHHSYGADVLLYMGMTESTVAARLAGHTWIEEEPDRIKVRIASVKSIMSWEAWDEDWDELDTDAPYPRLDDARLIRGIEALLIHAHQPAFNTMGKNNHPDEAKGLRVFNTGKSGLLLPEVSYAYYRQ